ncbi:MAG: hypothetical protein P4L79_15375 [Legionella sp.]|uniref:hypothetical protein n=1 Tax=Legionella sp. TaxID=459 RepID=UPI002850F79D|nr:hypothetical protein [Legionella sp.]
MFQRLALPLNTGSLLPVLLTYWQHVANSPFILPNEKERVQNIVDFITSCTSDEIFLKKLANPKLLGLIELYAIYNATYVLDTQEQEGSHQSMIQIIKSRVDAIQEPLSIFEQVRSQVRTLSVQDANIDEVIFYIGFSEKLENCANDLEFAAMINNNLLSSWELQLLQRLEFQVERQVDKQECSQFRQLIDSKAPPAPLSSFAANNSIGTQLSSNSSVLSQLKRYIDAQLQKEVPDHQFEMIFDLAAIFSELHDDVTLINFLKGKATDEERFVLGSVFVEGNTPEFYEFKKLVFPTELQLPEFKEATPEQLLSIEDSFTSTAVREAESLLDEMKIAALPIAEAAPSTSEIRKKIPLIYLFRQHLKEELSVKIKLECIIEDNQFFDLLSKNTFNLSLIELMELDALIQKYKTSLSEEQVKDFSINLASAIDVTVALNAATQSVLNRTSTFDDRDDDFWLEDMDGELLEDDDDSEEVEEVVEDEEEETLSCSP